MAITDIVTLPFGDPFGHFATDETTPQWLADVTVDLSDYDNARFALSLSATIKAAGGAIPTFSVVKQGDYAATVVALTPTASPAVWAAEMASAARVVGRGLTTFSLYGTSSPGSQVIYYPTGTGGVAPTIASRTPNPINDSFSTLLTGGTQGLFYATTVTGDPGLIIIPAGIYKFDFWVKSPASVTFFFYIRVNGVLTALGHFIDTGVSVLTKHVVAFTKTSDDIVPAASTVEFIVSGQPPGTATVVVGCGGSIATGVTVPWSNPAGLAEINAAALTLEFGDVDPAPRRPPPGPVGGDDIWLGEVD